MPVKRIASVSTKDRVSFVCHTVSDELIDWINRKDENGVDLPIRKFCHEGEGEKIPRVDNAPASDLITFEVVPLTVDEMGWADDQAVAHMDTDLDGNEGGRYENLKNFFAFRKALVRVRNLFAIGDVYEGATLVDAFMGIAPDIQREIGRVALRRSMIESADKKNPDRSGDGCVGGTGSVGV